jgi:hypothetical protein
MVVLFVYKYTELSSVHECYSSNSAKIYNTMEMFPFLQKTLLLLSYSAVDIRVLTAVAVKDFIFWSD